MIVAPICTGFRLFHGSILFVSMQLQRYEQLSPRQQEGGMNGGVCMSCSRSKQGENARNQENRGVGKRILQLATRKMKVRCIRSFACLARRG